MQVGLKMWIMWKYFYLNARCSCSMNSYKNKQKSTFCFLFCFVLFRAQDLCESGCGHPGLLATNSQYGLCGRKTRLKKSTEQSS